MGHLDQYLEEGMIFCLAMSQTQTQIAPPS